MPRHEAVDGERCQSFSQSPFQLIGTQASNELAPYREGAVRLREELDSAAFETEWAADRSLSNEAAMHGARDAVDVWEVLTNVSAPWRERRCDVA